MLPNLLVSFSELVKENLVLIIVLAVILVLIIALAIVMIVMSRKAKKLNEAPAEEEPAKEEAPAEEAKEEPAPAPAEEPAKEEAPAPAEEPAKEEAPAEETKEEPAPAEEPKEEEPAPEEEKAPAPKKDSYVFKPSKPAEKKPEPAAKASAANGKWVIEENKGKYWFSLIASNGEVMLESPTPYATLASAKSGIKTYQDNIAANRLEIAEHKNGTYQVQVLNARGMLLATSAAYKSRNASENASASIQRWAATTVIEVEGADEE